MAGDPAPSPWKRAVRVGSLSFLLAVAVSYLSDLTVTRVPALVAFLFILLLVSVNIAFDILGTSVTAADQSPLHAMAAKRVAGSRQALWLVRNADRVANFANDVIGDVTGAVTGAAGATVAMQLTSHFHGGNLMDRLLSLAMIGMVAGLTVGGKAAGKYIALNQATSVIVVAGRLLYGFEQITGRSLLGGRASNSSRRRT